MSRPKTPKSLVQRICDACNAVSAVPKRGENENYRYQKAAHVAAAFRHELFQRGVLLKQTESPPEYERLGTNGGEVLTECRLAVKFTLTDGVTSLEPDTHHGIGRDVEDKALYKAKTGATKYYLRALGLIPDEEDDPEFDDYQAEAETGEAAEPRRVPKGSRPLAEYEVANFHEACRLTGKTAEQIAAFLTTHNVARVEDLWRKYFKSAIRWASNGAGTLAPKLLAAGPKQASIFAPPPIEMKLKSGTVEVPPQKNAFSV